LFDTHFVFADKIALGDVKGDNHLDAVVTGGGTCPPDPSCFGKVSVLLGSGDGSFGTPQIFMTGAYAARDLALGDLNGDRKLDLVVANGSLSPDLQGPGAVGTLLGNG